jgi:hypothetical protein
MVTDSRQVDLAAGSQIVRFMPVATTTDPRGAILESGGMATGVALRHDAASREKLLDRFDGQRVEIFSAEASQILAGTLRMTPAGPLVEVGEKLYAEPPGNLILPGAGALALRPALDFAVSASSAWSGPATASYLASGLGWACEYTLRTDTIQTKGQLSQWAALRNQAGLAFRDAQITLVAGDARRGGGHPPRPYLMRAMAPGAPAADVAEVAPESFAVRYMFRLPGRLTLDRGDETRILLGGPPREVTIVRELRVEEGVVMFRQADAELPAKARARLVLENTERAGLGIPLPAGRVTVYTPDRRGKPQLAGEAGMPDTPSGQRILLDLGEAFDVTARRTQSHFAEFPDAKEVGYRIVLKNASDAAVTVDVIENVPGDWRMLNSSHEFERVHASQIRFRPGVPAGGETVLTYTVRINEPRKL